MAEARRAVEPLPALSLETPIDPTKHSVQVHRTGVGLSIFIPSPRILARNGWRAVKGWAVKMEHAFAPFPAPLVLSVVLGGVAWTVHSSSDSAVRNGVLGNVLWRLDSNYNLLLHVFEARRGAPVSVGVRVGYLALLASSGIVCSYAAVQRLILRNLLAYTGWMDETRAKKKSLKTVVWATLLNFVYIRGGAAGKTGSSVVIGPNPTSDPVIEKFRGQKQVKKGGKWMKKVVGILKRFLWTPPASTQAYQTSLPALPVPALEETLKRYMESMRPLIEQQQRLIAEDGGDAQPNTKLIAFDSVEDLESRCKAFLASEGPKLQRYLHWKFLTTPNYVSDWWMKFVYLRGRDSLMINSNYYGTGIFMEPPTTNQAARAAFYTYTLGQLVKEVAKERIPPLVIQGMVPMCMDQYCSAFGTTRIPGRECDRIATQEYRESTHVAVLHRGKIYKMPLYDPKSGKLLEPCQLEVAFSGILLDPTSVDSVEAAMIGSLTAWNRSLWAEARETFFLPHRANRTSLKVIERALFVVCLDHESDNDLLKHAANPDAAALTHSNPMAPWTDLTGNANNFMNGNGANRWFDKSLNVVVTPQGIAGMNGEHTWADATTLGHLWEIIMAREVYALPYGPDGTISDRTALLGDGKKNGINKAFFPAQRLHFTLSVETSPITVGGGEATTAPSTTATAPASETGIAPTLALTIRNAFSSAANQIADLDLVVSHFDAFGKGNVKKAKCSPDAFVQMALQIAFFKQRGFFVQTYESASTRLYRDGRTETIRSCSQQSCDFVRAFVDYKPDTASPEDKSRLQGLLRKACEKHVLTSTLAGSGRGVDRHLFALYVVSVGTETESPFLQSVMKHGWKLSTSQVPQQQANNEWLPGHNGDNLPRSSGGFGPVADDGYGVSYVICGENSFFFHVSSKRSCPATNSAVFRDTIFDALKAMDSLF